MRLREMSKVRESQSHTTHHSSNPVYHRASKGMSINFSCYFKVLLFHSCIEERLSLTFSPPNFTTSNLTIPYLFTTNLLVTSKSSLRTYTADSVFCSNPNLNSMSEDFNIYINKSPCPYSLLTFSIPMT